MSQTETSVAGYRFDGVHIDVRNRQVWRDGRLFPLNSKYLDALLLLVRERGRLVEKQRLFDEVWEGVPVTDAALTQCIKDIRRQIGDDASSPRYIKTVPKHGYLFIHEAVEVVPEGGDGVPAIPARTGEGDTGRGGAVSWRETARQGVGGMAGGGTAGVLGGLMLGGGLAMARHAPAAEAISLVFVMICLGIFIGAAGGLWVGAGMAAGRLALRDRRWGSVVGGVVGGAVVGGVAQVFGVDALRALFGHRITGITGAFEGAAVGLGTALGAALAGNDRTPAWGRIAGASAGAMCAAVSLSLIGGTLFSGSLEVLARSFSGSQIGMEPLAALFGEAHFGRTTQAVLGALEGALFGGGMMGGMWVVEGGRQTADVKPES